MTKQSVKAPGPLVFKCNHRAVCHSSVSQSELTEEDTESGASELLQEIFIHSNGLLGALVRLADGSPDNSYSIPTTPRPSHTDGTPQPGLTDGTPQPGLTDGTPQPGLTDGTPQPGLTDGTPQPGLTDGTPQPGLTDERKESGTTNLSRESSIHSIALLGVLSQLTGDFVGNSFGGPPDASQSQSQENCDVTGRDTGMT